MIKKYFDFLRESSNEGENCKSRNEFDSLGEWVEYLYDFYKDDEGLGYIKNIVGRKYLNRAEETIDDIEAGINLSNAVNILSDDVREEMEDMLCKYIENGIVEKKPRVLASTEIEPVLESELAMAGKGIFHSFLKSLTALGQKEKDLNFEKCPADFLLFGLFENLDAAIVKEVFERFRSLSHYLDLIDYGKNEVSLYFGIRCDGNLEYGVSYETRFPIGSFRISKSAIKWLNELPSKSLFSLKKELVNLSYEDIISLGKIKADMEQYNPGYSEKRMMPLLKDRVISFAYYGIGKWDNGKLDEGEYMNIKSNFVNWLMSKKWNDRVLISVKANSFWLYMHIKLK